MNALEESLRICEASAPSLRQYELDQVHRVPALPCGLQNLSPLSGHPW